MGGMFAGVISDKIFHSRRGPAARPASCWRARVLCFLVGGPYVGWMVVFMSMATIGVHGMLSGHGQHGLRR